MIQNLQTKDLTADLIKREDTLSIQIQNSERIDINGIEVMGPAIIVIHKYRI
jgi:hypothetical protein